jgi:hypothetical protein
MSKILKNSYQPIDETLVSLASFGGCLSSEDIGQIKILPKNIDEDSIIEERDNIEKCASSNKVYYYNSNWANDSIAQLKEYATVCKCKTLGINPDGEDFLKKANEIEKIHKEASVAVKEPSPLSAVMDPFNLDRDIDTSYLNKDKSWDKLSPEAKISKPTVLDKQHSITNAGGGDDYLKNAHLTVRRGQNSVTNPNAIESIVNDKSEDVGLRIRKERKEQEIGRKSEIVASEKKIALQGKDSGFGAILQGKVKMTESLNAQPGLKNKNIFNLDAKQTDGEKLAKQNEQRKASIQREVQKDERSWDKPQSQATHEISDVFTKTLAEKLKSIKK